MTAGNTERESPVAFRGWALMLGNAAHLLEGLWTGYSLPTNSEPGRATKQAACAFGTTRADYELDEPAGETGELA